MPEYPDRHEQIRLVHAEFIRQVAATCGNVERRAEFDALLGNAKQSGWAELAGALKRIAACEHCPSMPAPTAIEMRRSPRPTRAAATR